MLLIFLLLCAAPAASSTIPLIDGVDRSHIFNKSMSVFEEARTFVQIIGPVSSTFVADSDGLSDTLLSIGLAKSAQLSSAANYNGHYDYATGRLAELLGCTGVSLDNGTKTVREDVDFDDWQFSLRPLDKWSSDQKDDLLTSLLVPVWTKYNKWDRIEVIKRDGCTFSRAPEMMRLNFFFNTSDILSGWIVERYPLGEFSQCCKKSDYFVNNDTLVVYELEYFSWKGEQRNAHYNYIDARTGAIVNVLSLSERGENATRTWKRGSMSGGTDGDNLNRTDLTEFTKFRATSTGVLIDTLADTLHLSYVIDGQRINESVHLNGNHYHVSCDRKQGDSHASNATNDGVRISILSADKVEVHSYNCTSKRETPTGIPEVRELEKKAVKSIGLPVAPHDRVITKVDEGTREVHATLTPPTTTPKPAPSDDDYDHKNGEEDRRPV